jgi:outer membrane protein OmpA-like peptidoglycan-associated protein
MTSARARHAIDSIAGVLQRERVLFAAGSSALDPLAIARLTGIAALVRQVDQLAASIGGSARISLVGRTDLTGANETNAALAQGRIAAVAGFLAAEGIARDRLVPNPVATAEPLPAGDEAERARINRSVSFTVALEEASSASGGRQ